MKFERGAYRFSVNFVPARGKNSLRRHLCDGGHEKEDIAKNVSESVGHLYL